MATFSITRSVYIDADTARVHALINDLRQWENWSPWEELDPAMEHLYAGPPSGVGMTHKWRGNKEAGEGVMEITSSTPERVDVAITFVEPWPAQNDVRLDIADAEEGSRVTWTMSGRQNLVGRLFYLAFRMDDRLGQDFERGLTRLKAWAEAD